MFHRQFIEVPEPYVVLVTGPDDAVAARIGLEAATQLRIVGFRNTDLRMDPDLTLDFIHAGRVRNIISSRDMRLRIDVLGRGVDHVHVKSHRMMPWLGR